jgi:anti-sigma factor RsiW
LNPVASDGSREHLSSQQIQEFLDRQLSRREMEGVQEHLDICPGCQEEMRSWELLFSDLSALPELHPGPDLASAVLEETRVPVPARARPFGRLAAREATGQEEFHVPAASIQDYLENRLERGPSRRLEAHLHACSSCRGRLQEWKGLLEALGPLGHFSPAPGFAERVMTQVMMPAPLPAPSRSWRSIPRRAVAWTRSLLPDTRHGWAVAGGIASAPTIIMATLIYMVFSRPLLTPGNLGSYLLFKGSAVVETVVAFLSGLVMENATLSQWVPYLEPVVRSPMLLGLGGLAFSLMSAGALWVLYRNLIVPPSDDRYARARV